MFRVEVVVLRAIFQSAHSIAEMDQDTKTKFGQPINGCRFTAVALPIFLGCLDVTAASSHAVHHAPSTSLAIALAAQGSQWGAIFSLGVLVAVVLVLAAIGLVLRWHRRGLQQRDAEVFKLVENLRKEVSERKEAQKALEESQKFIMRQERLAAVGQLAAGLAHEFNNIMTIVQGHAAMLMDNPNLDDESTKSLAYVTEGVERMSKLIRQMLAFSSKQVMQQKVLDVRETLGHTSETLSRLLGEKVALSFEIAPRLPPILADPDMFQQIVVNLVVNARDAMSKGGQLTIRAAERSFAAAEIMAKSGRKAGRFVRLSVTDTGTGMDTAIISRLFEPFFTTKEIGKGTGLGLATVHGMVNQHQGWIEVESKLGQGTTFDIYFPASDQPLETEATPEDAPEVRGGKETVLVVEDEAVLRELVREILSIHGYSILEAANGLEGLNVWEENREKVDLLLTDMAMPHGLTGRELADKLRKDVPGLPVVFSSGHSQEMIESTEDAGQCTFYLSKPYTPTLLAQAVRHALDSAQNRETPVAVPTS
jgi:signal transduction histidine kinase/CheY-like chemotaxis protein